MNLTSDFETKTGESLYKKTQKNFEPYTFINQRLSARHRRGCLVSSLQAKKVKQSHYRQWTGPEGSRKLRFPGFVTTAQDGGKVVSLMHRPPLPPGNTPGTHFC